MIKLKTRHGYINWNIGELDNTARLIFSFGYCNNFAYILSKKLKCDIYCIIDKKSFECLHLFCIHLNNYIDINGIFTKCEYETHLKNLYNISISEDIVFSELGELYGTDECDENNEDNYLAESIIDKFIKLYF